MSSIVENLTVEKIAQYILRRKKSGEKPFILFLGAGASIASGNPSMNEVIIQFLNDMGVPKSQIQSMNEFDKVTKFYELTEQLSNLDRYDWFYSLFRNAKPSLGYQALSALIADGYFDLILTTNVDRLLEESILQDNRIQLIDYMTLIYGRERDEFIAEQLQSTIPKIKILKLHGDISTQMIAPFKGSFSVSQTFEQILREIFMQRDILMVGYSLNDLDLFRYLNKKNNRTLIFVNPYPPVQDISNILMIYDNIKLLKGSIGKFDSFMIELYKALKGVKFEKESKKIDKESRYKFDVALSFASEDRQTAAKLAKLLTDGGLRVFYDQSEVPNLWGTDLYKHLNNIYSSSRYCIILISSFYANKSWTTFEMKLVNARSKVNKNYNILPIRLDNTEIPSILSYSTFLDLTTTSIEEVSDLILKKVKSYKEDLKKIESDIFPEKNIHIISHKKGWIVKKEGASRILKYSDNKNDAVDYSKLLSKNLKSFKLIIHNKDGSVEKIIDISENN